MILVTLHDLPPSVNASLALRPYGPRMAICKTRDYTKWIEAAAMLVRAQRKGKEITGPVEFRFTARRPRSTADLDNRLKPAIDACQKGGAIQNDNQIVRIVAEWSETIDAPTVILTEAA